MNSYPIRQEDIPTEYSLAGMDTSMSVIVDILRQPKATFIPQAYPLRAVRGEPTVSEPDDDMFAGYGKGQEFLIVGWLSEDGELSPMAVPIHNGPSPSRPVKLTGEVRYSIPTETVVVNAS